jgi:hypothetical protein
MGSGSTVSGVLLAMGLATTQAIAAEAPPPDQLFPDGVAFDIVRKGETIGQQEVKFERKGETLTAHEVSDIVVRFLRVPVYRFHFEGTGLWRAGRALEVATKTNDDGTVSETKAETTDKGTVIDGPAGHIASPTPVLPVSHWNFGGLTQNVVLNTITGKLNRVTITDEGVDTIATPEGKRQAHRYVYRGELELTAWYDTDGHWVALRFLGKDGTPIDYVCRRCGPAPAATPAAAVR